MRLVEELALAYPQLDKYLVELAVDFDEQCQEKYGADYKFEDHEDEIFPEEQTNAVTVSEPCVTPTTLPVDASSTQAQLGSITSGEVQSAQSDEQPGPDHQTGDSLGGGEQQQSEQQA